MDFHRVYPGLVIFVLGRSISLVLWLRTCHNNREQGKHWDTHCLGGSLRNLSVHILSNIQMRWAQMNGDFFLSCFPRHIKTLVILFLMNSMCRLFTSTSTKGILQNGGLKLEPLNYLIPVSSILNTIQRSSHVLGDVFAICWLWSTENSFLP